MQNNNKCINAKLNVFNGGCQLGQSGRNLGFLMFIFIDYTPWLYQLFASINHAIGTCSDKYCPDRQLITCRKMLLGGKKFSRRGKDVAVFVCLCVCEGVIHAFNRHYVNGFKSEDSRKN